MCRNGQITAYDYPNVSVPNESWLFAQAISEKSISKPNSRRREENADRELLEWLACISTESEKKLRRIERRETAESELRQQTTAFAEPLFEQWDESKHPRVPKGQAGAGEWIGVSGSAVAGVRMQLPVHFQTADYRRRQLRTRLVAAGAAADWPLSGSIAQWLPHDFSGASSGARAGAALGLGSLLKGLQNATMTNYWARVPAVQVMPQYWIYDLDKRVKAGTLSHDDAVEIVRTGLLGAKAQGFKPTGRTMAETHRSMMDFLAKAEQVYFARKAGWATQEGGYQKSGGRVFPTKKNSGLEGFALRQEQQKFFERGLLEGKLPDQLRGQAHEAGLGRTRRGGRPVELDDPEVEAALRRAIGRAKK